MSLFRAAALTLFMVAESTFPSKASIVTPADLGTLTGHTSSGFTLSLTGGSFDLDITFKLLAPAPETLTSFRATLSDSSGSLTGLSLGLYSGNPGSGTFVKAGTVPITDPIIFASVVDKFTPNGSYYLEIKGNSPINEDLTVTGNAFTAAVPEPGTWALMGIGFACVGFLAYRRKGSGAAFRLA
jgi:hypothetical protein